MTAVRPEVVGLLTDVRPDPDLPPSQWTHMDGRPLTEAEADLAGSATREELLAVRDYATKVADHAHDRAELIRRVHELCAPYWDRLGDGATTADVAAAMPDHERRELAALLERIAPA